METYKKLNIIAATLLILNVILALLFVTKFPILILLLIFISVISIILTIISICKKRSAFGTVLLVISILMTFLFVL